METLDYIVLLIYVAGIFAVGGIFSTKIKDSTDMFAAGGQSPWWTSGLSSFMTMFSAGTFVVWGSIAFKWGMVAVSINMCYGVAALLVGYFVAGHWRRLGVRTPAEYVQLRFGKAAIHFYTWTMMIYRMVGVGVALYSLAVLLVALMPLSEGNPLRDPATGNLALHWAVLLFGLIVVVYTMIGGLWAVLMTDVLQFIVLNLAVLFVVPLCLLKVGGLGSFVASAPPGFFIPTTPEFPWIFLAGWCAIHFFMVGAEWAFAQRFLCVPTQSDARKSAYLFGILYLVSPILWLLPPMLYRAMAPDANSEEAYILACRSVLPPGMVGLMLAAMFSATASMVSSQLNVFAGVLTSDFYRGLFHPAASERHLVTVGRLMTAVLGTILIAIALAVPLLGGAERVVLSVTSLLVTPLLAPTIWGLFSRRVGASCIWPTAAVSFSLGILLKFGFAPQGWFANYESLAGVSQWLQSHLRSMEIVVGVIVPVGILTIIQMTSRTAHPGYQRVADLAATQSQVPARVASRLPALMVAWSIGVCGMVMAALALFDREQWHILLGFAVALFAISATIAWAAGRTKGHNENR